MDWTSKPPTKSGYYWHRKNGKESRYRVFLSSQKTICQIRIGMFCQKVDTKEKLPVEDVDGEWYGPLTEPFNHAALLRHWTK